MLEYLSAYLLQLFVHFLLVCLYPSFIIKASEEELHLYSKNDYGLYTDISIYIYNIMCLCYCIICSAVISNKQMSALLISGNT